MGRDVAERWWAAIRTGPLVLQLVGAADLERAFAIGELFPDQTFSIVDRTSFAVMERLGLQRAATFDDHFAVYRFGPKRQHAFAIVR